MKRIDIEEISPLCKSIFDYNFELHKIVDTDPFWEAHFWLNLERARMLMIFDNKTPITLLPQL